MSKSRTGSPSRMWMVTVPGPVQTGPRFTSGGPFATVTAKARLAEVFEPIRSVAWTVTVALPTLTGTTVSGPEQELT